MNDLPLISVVVPVYKVEKYLNKCIQSIVDQTYRNLEIILVDDGSPDQSGAICDEWARRDDRIRVIHKENGGLSDARNAGMKVASGSFLSFVDSDDWVSLSMIQTLYEALDSADADLSACGIQLEYEDGTPHKSLTMSGKYVFSTEEALLELIHEERLLQPVCGKLYRTAQIRGVPFPVGKHHEDTFWTYQAVARAKRIAVFDTPGYHYLQRGSSIMGVGFSLKRLHSLEAKRNLVDFCHSHYPMLEEDAAVQLLLSCLYAMQGCLHSLKGDELATGRRIVSETAAQIAPIPLSAQCTLKKKVLIFCAQRWLEGTAKVLNFLIDIHILT